MREFLRTETGSAVVLLAATVAALVWVNVDSIVLRVAVAHAGSRSAWAAPA